MSTRRHPETTPHSAQHLEVTTDAAGIAMRTGLSLRQIRHRIANGELRSIKVGSRRLIRIRDLEEFLDQHEATPSKIDIELAS